MIVAKTINAKEEKDILEGWFATVEFDDPSEGIPPLAPEDDDEESRANPHPKGNPYRDAAGKLTSKDKAVYDIRHLPGKHNQKDHGFKHVGNVGPATPSPPKDASKWALAQDRNLNEGQVHVLGYNSGKAWDDPISHQLVSIGKHQGFDAKPTKGSVDDTIAKGGVEIHRGVIPHTPHNRPGDAKSADQLVDEFKNGPYEPGTGNFGNGYYFTTAPGVAKMYSKAPVATADNGYNAKEVGGGKVIRAALKPDAKIAHYEDIKKQAQEWRKKHYPNVEHNPYAHGFIIPDGKISPVVMDGVHDPGHFAALMGYDAIRVPLKDRPQDRRNRALIRKKSGDSDIGDEIVVLNRGALVVDDGA